jgi:hypothetical protein
MSRIYVTSLKAFKELPLRGGVAEGRHDASFEDPA